MHKTLIDFTEYAQNIVHGRNDDRLFLLVKKYKDEPVCFCYAALNELFTGQDWWIDKFSKHIVPVFEKYNIGSDRLVFFTGPNTGTNRIRPFFKHIWKINWWPFQTWYRHEYSDQTFNTKWNENSSKGLLMLGKLTRPHRIGTISALIAAGRLNEEHFEWSLAFPKKGSEAYQDLQQVNEMYDLIPDIDQAKAYERSLDFPLKSCYGLHHKYFHYTGFPYDPDLFAKTGWSLISETEFKNWATGDASNKHLPWITEKTYKALINHHPFIVLGSLNTYQYLKSLGFEVFDQYLGVPPNNLCGVPHVQYFQTILCDVIDRFKNAMIKDSAYFREATEHNHNLVKKIATHQYNLYKKYTVYCEGIQQEIPIAEWLIGDVAYPNNLDSPALRYVDRIEK